jgi:hypothetical protein
LKIPGNLAHHEFKRHFARSLCTDIKSANPHASKRSMGIGSSLLDSLPNQIAAHLHPALMLFSADMEDPTTINSG